MEKVENKPVKCRCGRDPEVDEHLRGYKYSLHCNCGDEEINLLVQSDNQRDILDTWDSVVNRKPHKHYIERTGNPDLKHKIIHWPSMQLHEPDPLRRYCNRIGGSYSGGGGPC